MSFPETEPELDSTLYWAARLEDAVSLRINTFLRRRGWEPRVLTYTSYGGTGWARILARVLLAPPEARTRDLGGARGWRRFFAATAPGVGVTVAVGGQRHEVVSGRGGYLDTMLSASLEPGWATAHLSAAGSSRPPSPAPIRVVADGPGLGIVSDIDDTVVITALPRPLVAFWNTFLRHETSRRPVSGMAGLYRSVMASEPSAFVVYLSTGAWNVAPSLRDFLGKYGFPRGPLLLTDWGPTTQGMFRSGTAHKRDQLRRLFTELPQLRWLLVGDDGQHDPEVYGEAAAQHGEQVAAVAIRQLSVTEQVLTHGTPEPLPPTSGSRGPSALRHADAEQLQAPDGHGLLVRLRERGLLQPRVA